jgi:hypothetical protein
VGYREVAEVMGCQRNGIAGAPEMRRMDHPKAGSGLFVGLMAVLGGAESRYRKVGRITDQRMLWPSKSIVDSMAMILDMSGLILVG